MRFRSALTVAAFAAGSIGLSQPAHAQFQDIIEGIGFGREKEGLEYRERPPLVVPPNLNLRPPEERSAATREARWPNDPDIARRRAAIEDERKPRVIPGQAENRDRNLALSPDELRRGRIAGGGVNQKSEYDERGYERGSAPNGTISPDRLRAEGEEFRGKQDPPLRPGEEPKRRYLTDPPVGARAAAANAPLLATAEKAKSQNDESSPYDFFRRITGNDD